MIYFNINWMFIWYEIYNMLSLLKVNSNTIELTMHFYLVVVVVVVVVVVYSLFLKYY